MKYQANLIIEGLSEIEIDKVSVFIEGEHKISVIPEGPLRKTMSCINMVIEAYYSSYFVVTGRFPKDKTAGKSLVRYSVLQILKAIAGK